MQHDRAPVPVHQPASIQVPDQLQQAKRSDEVGANDLAADPQVEHHEPARGILHELRTDRAHD